MELILSCQIGSDAISSSGNALYALICLYPVRIFSVLLFYILSIDFYFFLENKHILIIYHKSTIHHTIQK